MHMVTSGQLPVMNKESVWNLGGGGVGETYNNYKILLLSHIFRYEILPKNFPCFGANFCFVDSHSFGFSALEDPWLMYTS